jgi:N-acetylneuraminate synthase
MKIGSVVIGPALPCRVVAELSNAHNGDYDRARRLCDAVQASGADLIKFQCYLAEELVALRGNGPAPEPWGAQGWAMERLYRQAQTPLAWFMRLVAHCDEIGLPWFSSVFGQGSYTLLEALGCPAYKIASLEYGKRGLVDLVRKAGKPILRSCPHPTAPKTDDVMLYCPPGYPQAGFDVRTVQRGYEGFSYHGRDPVVPLLAAAFGAQFVEVHVELDDEPSALESACCLPITALASLVAGVQRAAEVCRDAA